MQDSISPLDVAKAKFFAEFDTLENVSVSAALRSLSDDARYVRQAEKLLELDARLDLLKRLSFVRRVPSALAKDLDAAITSARKLNERRNALLSTGVDGDLAIARTEGYIARTVALQGEWHELTHRLVEVRREPETMQG